MRTHARCLQRAKLHAHFLHRWRGVEFVVRPYKDAKDTWLLGGVEEVSALLEDSLIALGAIAASRYVGGIRWVVCCARCACFAPRAAPRTLCKPG